MHLYWQYDSKQNKVQQKCVHPVVCNANTFCDHSYLPIHALLGPISQAIYELIAEILWKYFPSHFDSYDPINDHNQVIILHMP